MVILRKSGKKQVSLKWKILKKYVFKQLIKIETVWSNWQNIVYFEILVNLKTFFKKSLETLCLLRTQIWMGKFQEMNLKAQILISPQNLEDAIKEANEIFDDCDSNFDRNFSLDEVLEHWDEFVDSAATQYGQLLKF